MFALANLIRCKTPMISLNKQAPGEVTTPGSCLYWAKNAPKKLNRGIGQAVAYGMVQKYRVFSILYDGVAQNLGGEWKDPIPSLDEFLSNLTSLYTMPTKDCKDGLRRGDPAVIKETDKLNSIAGSAGNKIWSFIHFMTFNQPATMSLEQVEASRAVAVLLSRGFYCMECRSFFTSGILEPYGPPPLSNNRDAHAKYWVNGHNVAGEHVATTIGGMPFVHPLGDDNEGLGKNPFYLPFAVAQEQWTYKKD